MLTRDEIAQQALTLPPDDRAYVAEILEQSLRPGDFATPEIAAAWENEIERRARVYERGEMPAEDWRTSMARLRNESSTADQTPR